MPALPLPPEETLNAIADHREEYFKGWKLCDSTTQQSTSGDHVPTRTEPEDAPKGANGSAEGPEASTNASLVNGAGSSQGIEGTNSSSSNGRPPLPSVQQAGASRMASGEQESRDQRSSSSGLLDNVSLVANGEGYMAINCVHGGRTYTGILLADGRDGFPGLFPDSARATFASQCAYDKQGHPFDQWTSYVDDRQVQAPRPKKLVKTNFAKSGGRMLCYNCLTKVPKDDPGSFGCNCKERQKNRLAMKRMRNRQQRDRTTVVAQLSGFDEHSNGTNHSGASSPARQTTNDKRAVGQAPRKRKASSGESSPAVTRSQSIDYNEYPEQWKLLLGDISASVGQLSPPGSGASRRKLPKAAVRRTALEDCTVPVSTDKAGPSGSSSKKLPTDRADDRKAVPPGTKLTQASAISGSPKRPTSMALAVQPQLGHWPSATVEIESHPAMDAIGRSVKPTSVVKPRVQTPSGTPPRATSASRPATSESGRPSMSGMPPSGSRSSLTVVPTTAVDGASSPSSSYAVRSSEKPLHLTLVKVSPTASSSESAADTTPLVSPVPPPKPPKEVPSIIKNGKFTINIGDVVWARAPPCAFWPGTVIDIVSETEAAINWIGEKTHSVVTWANIEEFEAQLVTRFLRNDSKDKYCASIAEAIFRAKIPAERLDRKISFKVASVLIRKYGYDMDGKMVCLAGKWKPYKAPQSATPTSSKKPLARTPSSVRSSSRRSSSVLNFAPDSFEAKEEPLDEDRTEPPSGSFTSGPRRSSAKDGDDHLTIDEEQEAESARGSSAAEGSERGASRTNENRVEDIVIIEEQLSDGEELACSSTPQDGSEGNSRT
ncbi:hypothetical protein AAVH_16110 [Aphelenchoides avenae]|nr:hypothetical protein AAVH_16110 [Aphelenchus avenae]